MTLTWKDLPFETIQLILNLISRRDTNTFSQCALVCKSWKSAVDHRLYTIVALHSIRRLKLFNRTLTDNTELADLVKHVELFIDVNKPADEHKAYVYTLLSNLPNLESFSPHYLDCYIPVMDALLDSKLTKLRLLLGATKANQSMDDYITCALLMKDRLQNIHLSLYNSDKSSDYVSYDRLYNRLHQFEKLEILKIMKTSRNIIMDIDSAVDKCSSTLRQIQCMFVSMDYDRIRSTAAEDSALSVYSPRPEIRVLTIYKDDATDDNLLSYIMHRYPQLKKLHLSLEEGTTTVDGSLLQQFISYLSEIDDISINSINTSLELVHSSLGSYWEAMSLKKPRQLENVTIVHSGRTLSDTSLLSFKLTNEPGLERTTTIKFPFSASELERINLFEKYQEYIGTVKINLFSKKMVSWGNTEVDDAMLGKFITSILANCKHLKKFYLEQCDINYNADDDTFNGKSSLQVLELFECEIGRHNFSTLFGGVEYIDSLNLVGCKYRDQSNKLGSSFNIDVPHTKIRNLSILDHKNPHRGNRYLLLSIAMDTQDNSENSMLYYFYDFVTMNDNLFEATSKEEYDNSKYQQHTRIHFHCRSVSSVQVTYNNCTIQIPVII